MIPQAYITAWRSQAPWADDAQVEQDLVLTRAVVELFGDAQIGSLVALRGGTALNKLFLKNPARYSEDIDLVQTSPAPIGPLLDQIRTLLDPWLGEPRRAIGRMVTLAYRFDSETPPVRTLRVKIEINTHEHFSVLGYQKKSLAVVNDWFTRHVGVSTYQLNELMGTKMRALYQRNKGRDLFDLWLCLERGLLEPAVVVDCFLRYMQHEQHHISRAQYEQNLLKKADNREFMSDITPLLAGDLHYDPRIALDRVMTTLVSLVPGEPWRRP